MVIGSYRRFLLFALHSANATSMIGLAGALRGIRTELPGTPLDSSFPQYAALIAAEYTCVEDLTGSDADELVAHGLTSQQAAAVIAALG